MAIINGRDTSNELVVDINGAALVKIDKKTNAIQYSSGTFSQTSNILNSASPGAVTLSNIVASYLSLGGNFIFPVQAGSENDYLLYSFQNPTGASNSNSRNLVIHDINISSFNTGVANALLGTVLQWSVGVGASSASLATVDSANSKAYRRFPLGIQVLPTLSAVGGALEPANLTNNFNTPLVIAPGEYLSIILKIPVGTATALQAIRGSVSVSGYWE